MDYYRIEREEEQRQWEATCEWVSDAYDEIEKYLKEIDSDLSVEEAMEDEETKDACEDICIKNCVSFSEMWEVMDAWY